MVIGVALSADNYMGESWISYAAIDGKWKGHNSFSQSSNPDVIAKGHSLDSVLKNTMKELKAWIKEYDLRKFGTRCADLSIHAQVTKFLKENMDP